ncbi:La-related protein 6 [Tetrabaena socialis]|uniref:La-related protein 6 n=1 Tax=Tetrabaena socialis TaxID=47790 RepID=A0A2J8AGM3_9CHLO|nr:La-related protein 6 [Tetrabaena socialis]|eukprot:PNH11664.1 La-related protein 6 [Tetrabaena socialis]
MAYSRASPADSVEAELSLSASEDENGPQEVTPELLAALVKQVEFYFSDANLPSDKKLLKQIRKDADGYVPVKLFANFRKVRALSKDVPVITEALRCTTLLQLSDDCKRVRRLVPVPEYDISDIQRRTIVVENLPGDPSPTIESVTEMFRMYGRVKLVRICSRESKGKLPSWLTSSVQNMAGQHAYIEFEEEEGAVLAAAALAQDYDAPDGAAQVRRLTACIAEQRERRSGHGGGSSFGGSSGGSRKGSRDVSPLGSRAGSSGGRRNSNGGASYGGNGGPSYGNSVSCGGASSWTSAGGAAEPVSHHYSYGGSYEPHYGSTGGAMPTRRSGGGAPPPHASFPPPPPPPPARRSADSAPPADVSPLPRPVSARLNIYRPPGKRLSDGSQAANQLPSLALPRASGGSFTSASSACAPAAGFASSTPSSGASTPTAAAAPPSPPLPPPPSSAASPPLVTRAPITTAAPPHPAGPAAGKPPVHPPLAPQHTTSALAEAIAHAQAERRASEAGYRAATAVEAIAAAAPLSTSAGGMEPAAAVVVAHVPRAASIAPKFCFDPAAGLPSSRRTSLSALSAADSCEQVVGSAGSAGSGCGMQPLAPKLMSGAAAGRACSSASVAPGALPRGAQMVADVEGFINNILARPTTRPAPAAPSAAPQQQRKQAPTSLAPKPVDAAAAVTDILAAAFRRTSPPSTDARKPAVVPAAAAKLPAATAVILTAPAPARDAKAFVALAPAPVAPVPVPAFSSRPMVYITAIAAGEDHEDHAALLEHAVTVTVHHTPPSKLGKQQQFQQAPKAVLLGGSSPAAGSTSPRDFSPQQPSSGGGGKRLSRRDYAQWAAATPGFRAEASLKFAAASMAQQRSSGGGAGPNMAYAPASYSDGGAGPAAHGSGQASWHVARGPDGSRGFSGRGNWVNA